MSVHAAVRVGFAYYTLGHFRHGAELFREHEALLSGDLLYERFGHVALPSVHCRVYRALCLAERGEFDEAVRLADAAW